MIYLNTIIRRYLVILIKDMLPDEINNIIKCIQSDFMDSNKKELFVVYSEVGYFKDIPNLYNETYNCLKYSFVIGSEDISGNKNSNLTLISNFGSNEKKMEEKLTTKKYSSLVNRIIKNIYVNIENENFSLKWLAREIIFMNEGYLSKVFRRETGEKFSSYLLRVRMEKAIDLIVNAEDGRVYEVASKVGLGLNPQYFSQLFKKYTGFTPTEYKNEKFGRTVKKVNIN
jgi:YesN/AraC family two-component response regulator